ncbi:hypothetical protein CSE64_001871 [Escherichia coli]|nr:hypothetical protein [Escherichia coli]EFC6241875.1 hypothetical protein [Escherichia coli]
MSLFTSKQGQRLFTNREQNGGAADRYEVLRVKPFRDWSNADLHYYNAIWIESMNELIAEYYNEPTEPITGQILAIYGNALVELNGSHKRVLALNSLAYRDNLPVAEQGVHLWEIAQVERELNQEGSHD